MDTRSFVTLVVDYEVPPQQILDAIADGKLHPIVAADTDISLENISFRLDEVENLFWAYDLKRKSAAEKADLSRRLQRYDAIRTNIVSAVAASGITAVAASVIEEGTFAPIVGPDNKLRAPEFRSPLAPSNKPFEITIGALEVSIKLRSSRLSRFTLRAARNGIALLHHSPTPNMYILPRVSINHGANWWSSYTADEGSHRFFVTHHQRVQTGQPLLEIAGNSSDKAVAQFGLWHASQGDPFDEWSSFTHLVDWT